MWSNLEMKFGTQPESKSSRLEEEDKLWKPSSGSPICNARGSCLSSVQAPDATARTLPPSHAVAFAQGHDEGMQRAMASLLEGMPGDAHQQAVAQDIASLPMRMGGLGIRSASRLALAAFWASWADALPMLEKRLPTCSRNHNNPGGNRWGAVWASVSWPHACWIAGGL